MLQTIKALKTRESMARRLSSAEHTIVHLQDFRKLDMEPSTGRTAHAQATFLVKHDHQAPITAVRADLDFKRNTCNLHCYEHGVSTAVFSKVLFSIAILGKSWPWTQHSQGMLERDYSNSESFYLRNSRQWFPLHFIFLSTSSPLFSSIVLHFSRVFLPIIRARSRYPHRFSFSSSGTRYTLLL